VSLDVLITAGSRRVPLVQAFQRALRSTGGGRVIVTDVNPLSPAVYAADRSFAAPLSSDPSYLDVIARIAEVEQVRLVIPTIDDELPIFAAAADRFAAAGVMVAVSPLATAVLCNDKHAACRWLAARGVRAAATCLPAELPADPAFPLFIKPRAGRGSVGAFPVRSRRELDFFLDYVADPVIQAYLDGPEFTIDVLCDFSGEPLSIVPRERAVIRAGVVDRGRTVRDARLMDLGIACTRALRFAGAVNIQCRMVDGVPIVFEINPRFSGGIPLTIAAGADFPRLLVELARGRRVAPSLGRFQSDLWMTSYEASMFLPEGQIGFTATSRPIAEVA
jgi:carbamoyl-phosphate synthase large subunit